MILRILIAQINLRVGDVAANRDRVIAVVQEARDQRGADLVVFPELTLTGYPPEDLLLRPELLERVQAALEAIRAASRGIGLVLGYPKRDLGSLFNVAGFIHDGRLVAEYAKQRLPNYSVFDEKRYFQAGQAPAVVDFKGLPLGLLICEDVWEEGPTTQATEAGARLLINLNASPYHTGKAPEREDLLVRRAREHQVPILYANLVGGQDELIFDGASFALDADGTVRAAAPHFAEALLLVEIRDGRVLPGEIAPALAPEAEVYGALVLGVRDYLGKNGFPGAIIGLSGGIDSALTLAIAVDALGPERVRAVMMPSPYTAQISLDDSRAMVETLGVRYDEVPIEGAMHTFASLLAPVLDAAGAGDTTEENVQARVRGLLLMALSNRSGALVLTTGNKSEMAVGYCTLYGDMAGGFAVIKDIAKTLVYRLANWRNAQSPEAPVIPERIITRAPSAELRPNQTDQDSLPPYEVLDAIVEAYMEKDISPRAIIESGYSEADVRRVVRLLRISEYKRRQAPVGIRVTQRGFGKDWRYPITNRYRDAF